MWVRSCNRADWLRSVKLILASFVQARRSRRASCGDGKPRLKKTPNSHCTRVQNEEVKDFSEISKDLESTSLDFFLTEIGVANTFLELAALTADRETARRNVRNARVAYDTVSRFLQRTSLKEADRSVVEDGLRQLEQRLGAAEA
jgi:hypothetical protein